MAFLYQKNKTRFGIKDLAKDIDMRMLYRSGLNIYPTDFCNRRCGFCKLTGILTTSKNRADMSMKDIDTIIDFCKRSNIHWLRILGGEPSQHPQIVNLIGRIYEKGLRVAIIFTNGIFDNDELIKCVLRHNITVNMNYFPREEYKNGQWNLVQENMRKIFLGRDNLKQKVGQGRIKDRGSILSITFYKPNQEYRYIIDACLKYGVGYIRWAASHSSITQENMHLNWRNFKEMVPLMVNFVRDAVKAGIFTSVECGLVPCILTKEDYHFLLRFADNFTFKCEPKIDVFPDLSVHYCMGMPIVSRITENNTLSQIILEQALIAEYFRRRPRSKGCLKCEWWQSKICQGYCLQYKYDKDNPQDYKLLSGLKWLEERMQGIDRKIDA